MPAPVIADNAVTIDYIASAGASTIWCRLDDDAAALCADTAVSYRGLTDGTHTVTIWATDSSGRSGASIDTTFTVDTTGPTLTLTSTPAATITGHVAGVSFTTDDPTSTTWCSLDGAAPTTCTSPAAFTGLRDGEHTVTLHGVDRLGNTGPAVRTTFTVDTTAPEVTLTGVPAGVVPSKSVSIEFTIDDPTATASCSLDGAAAMSCHSPMTLSDLGDGSHTFAVHAVDPAGNVGATVSHTFTVNSTAPTVTFGAVPAQTTNQTSATVAFSVDDRAATAWCSLDGGPAAVCTDPVTFTGLSDGPHTIAVYAVSNAGRQGSTVTTGFTVDTVAPDLVVTAAPRGSVRSADATIAFRVDDPTATVWCTVDAGPARVCTSPADFRSLAPGAHTVSLVAVDPAGNGGPATRVSFTIDDTAPVVTLTTAPPSPSASSTVSAGFTVNDPAAQAWCSLDGAPAQTCSGSVTYSGLSRGRHTIRIYAVDAAGNTSATVSNAFTVAGDAPVFTRTPSGARFGLVVFTWVAEPGLTYEYSYSGTSGPWRPTTTTSSNTSVNFVPGTYTFRLRGVDSSGKHTDTATFTFTVL